MTDETFPRNRNVFFACVRLCRVDHWVKNALVVLPAFFLGTELPRTALPLLVPAFLSFSFASSAVYLLNDWFDREKDRAHPTKRNRPLASGAVGGRTAFALLALLLACAFGFLACAFRPLLASLTLVAYLGANVAYSRGLKDVALVDIFILASGFVFRIFFGGFFLGIQISSWLFLCVFSAALYFACGKRRCELRQVGSAATTRPVLAAYTPRFLDAHYYVFCALTIVFYCLWTITRTDQHAVGKLALTIPLVVFILARYNLIVESGTSDGDPVPVLLHDRWLLLAVALFGATSAAVLYFGAFIPRISYW